MTAFLWTCIIMLALDLIGRVVAMGRHDYSRTPFTMAVDGFANAALLAWGLVIIFGNVK